MHGWRGGNLAVSVGAVVGVLGRFLISRWVGLNVVDSFPLGTLVVNLLGCLLIGAAQPLLGALVPARRELQLLVVVGVLGGFTTFSTLSAETLQLLSAGRVRDALIYQGLSLAGGLLAVLAGVALAHGVQHLTRRLWSPAR